MLVGGGMPALPEGMPLALSVASADAAPAVEVPEMQVAGERGGVLLWGRCCVCAIPTAS